MRVRGQIDGKAQMESLRHVYDVQTPRIVHLAPTVHGSELPIGSGGLQLAFWHFGTCCAVLPLHVTSVVLNDHHSLCCHIVVSIKGVEWGERYAAHVAYYDPQYWVFRCFQQKTVVLTFWVSLVRWHTWMCWRNPRTHGGYFKNRSRHS